MCCFYLSSVYKIILKQTQDTELSYPYILQYAFKVFLYNYCAILIYNKSNKLFGII